MRETPKRYLVTKRNYHNRYLVFDSCSSRFVKIYKFVNNHHIWEMIFYDGKTLRKNMYSDDIVTTYNSQYMGSELFKEWDILTEKQLLVKYFDLIIS